MTPNCPIHGQPMRHSPAKTMPDGKVLPESYYCSKMVGIGQPGANAAGYCNQRIKVNGTPQLATPAVPRATPNPDETSLRLAALNFGVRLYQGSGPATFNDGTTGEDAAMSAAERALKWLRGSA